MFKLNQYLQIVKYMQSCIVFYLMRPKHMYLTDGFEWVYIELHDCRVFSKTNRENYIQK